MKGQLVTELEHDPEGDRRLILQQRFQISQRQTVEW